MIKLKLIVIIKLKGGLGNQLFQYAFGKYMELNFGVSALYDARGLENANSPRKLELRNFNLFDLECKKFIIKRSYSLRNILNTLIATYYFRRAKIVNENLFGTLVTKPEPAIYYGYWQNWNYVKYLEPDFEKYFKRSSNCIAKVTKIKNSVAIHIRGTDYLKNNYFNQLGFDYYSKGINLIRQNVCSPIFKIFTDDIVYANKLLSDIHDVNFVLCNTGVDISDFWAISDCEHQIIANSTFSWWASVISINPDKIVIAPKIWNKDGINHIMTNEFITI